MPALAAASLTIMAFAAASYFLFRLVELGIERWISSDDQRHHLVQSIASFATFNIFYLFAGAPTLRQLPGGGRALAFLVPVLSSFVFLTRWQRSQERYSKEKSAEKIVRRWKFDQPPPDDPSELLAFVRGEKQAQDTLLKAYGEVVRELPAEGEIHRAISNCWASCETSWVSALHNIANC